MAATTLSEDSRKVDPKSSKIVNDLFFFNENLAKNMTQKVFGKLSVDSRLRFKYRYGNCCYNSPYKCFAKDLGRILVNQFSSR